MGKLKSGAQSVHVNRNCAYEDTVKSGSYVRLILARSSTNLRALHAGEHHIPHGK